jgi:hypothetical protein
MGGGLMQLVAYGAQDVYLTGNPQITFFKVVYRRHTNFSMECIRQNFSGSLDLGGQSTATISRNGDLIGQMYLQYKLKDSGINTNLAKLVPNFGNALIRMAEVEIGGQTIDRQDGRFMQMYTDLTKPNPTGNPCGVCKHNKLVGTGANLADRTSTEWSTTVKSNIDYWVPFMFWFCRNPGLYLPLIALQYHEVKLRLELNDMNSLLMGDSPQINGSLFDNDLTLWVDYIYLDTDERRRFAQVSHEYLIEQVQMKKQNIKNLSTTKNHNIKLNFNHPVKELMWAFSKNGDNGLKSNSFPGCPSYEKSIQIDLLSNESGVSSKSLFYPNQEPGNTKSPDQGAGGLQLSTISDIADFCPRLNYKIVLNGHDRFSERSTEYFNLTQIWKYHTGYGSCYPVGATNVYSFALKPEEHQPSGTCNFSRIDNASLNISKIEDSDVNTGNNVSEINIYAINYNVLRIMSGMGGLAYSN